MDKFEEYKFFAESTQYLSERRQNATQTYLGVNTAIFAVLGFLVKDGGFTGFNLFLISLPLFLVGLLVCSIWLKIITQYKGLIGWRYDQLMEMENSIDGCHRMYKKEWDNYFKPISGKEKYGFSRLEKWLPQLFMFLYSVYLIGLFIVSTWYAFCFVR